MEKKNLYTRPTVELVELEAQENILQASALTHGDSNSTELTDELFSGEFRSNSNIWDID